MQTLHILFIISIQLLHNQFCSSHFAELSYIVGEEQSCNLDFGRIGTCVRIENCPVAIKQIIHGGHPKTCGVYPIVCCETASFGILNDHGSIATQNWNYFGEEVQGYNLDFGRIGEVQGYNLDFGRIGDYVHIEKRPEAIKQNKDEDYGSIAKKKCQEYSEVAYGAVIGGQDADPVRSTNIVKYIQNKQQDNTRHLFQAILGYGSPNDIKWVCRGCLVSEKFVITVADCINTRYGEVRYVRLGVQYFQVKQKYRSRSQDYRDIGVIELNRRANFQLGVRPACLQTQKQAPTQSGGFGGGADSQQSYGSSNNILETGNFSYIPTEACTKYYNYQNRLPNGVINDWQICADGGRIRDTCRGDSGGFLQTKLVGDNLYTIVGIVSAENTCADNPGIYTTISYYLPWIESIVWPEEWASTQFTPY